MEFLNRPTRNLFFTGKGGVGKTTIACSAALRLAGRGRRVLLVSTDPASNLDEVLGTELESTATAIEEAPNLWAMNIDPERAAADYRERMVAPYRGVLPDAAIRSMEEQFSGSCTLEIAAFDEFAKLLGDRDATKDYDHVVFDTAPTGHTLRLLTLPSAWTGFIDSNTSGTSCLGPLAGLERQQSVYRQTVQSLGDAQFTTLILVSRPERSALQEVDRTSGELRSLGLDNQHLVINGVFESQDDSDPIAVAMEARCEQALADAPSDLLRLRRTLVPLAPGGLLGVDRLRSFSQDHQANGSRPVLISEDAIGSAKEIARRSNQLDRSLELSELVESLSQSKRGVIMTMGKGGVGKTTVAAAVAVALAEKGLPVELSTTDPAAHLSATLAADALEGLAVRRIDPREETEAYRDEVMRTAGAGLDAKGKALLEEDLRSPCTEEIAVFRAFARAVADGQDRFVVLDTAPTGHTILLLDSALAYHREVTRQSSQLPESVENLLPRLRDKDFTRVLVVTLPESTPVHEAAKLQTDLRRAGIEPYAWIVNQSLTPHALSDPILIGRQAEEAKYIDEVLTQHSERTAIVGWMPQPPVGLEGLRRFISGVPTTSVSQS